MSARIPVLLIAAVAVAPAGLVAAQIPPAPSPAPVVAPVLPFGQTFPPGAKC